MLNVEDLFLLDGLTECERKIIISDFPASVNFKKGEVIYSADKFSNSLGFICSGKAFAVTNNGQGVFMKSFESGTCFGAAAIFGSGEKYVSTVIAKTDTTVLFINEELLNKIFLNYPKTAVNYISFLSDITLLTLHIHVKIFFYIKEILLFYLFYNFLLLFL